MRDTANARSGHVPRLSNQAAKMWHFHATCASLPARSLIDGAVRQVAKDVDQGLDS